MSVYTNSSQPVSHDTSTLNLGVKKDSVIPGQDGLSAINVLPNELLDSIFSHLDDLPPSQSEKLYDRPAFDITSSLQANLKAISLVCRQWRSLVLPLVFKHTRVLINRPEIPRPIFTRKHLPLLEVVRLHNLKGRVASFTIVVEFRNDIALQDINGIRSNDFSGFWNEIFDCLDPRTVTIVAMPQVVGALTNCYMDSRDGWHFDMPYHVLQLSMNWTPSLVALKDQHIAKKEHEADISRTRPSKLFQIRPWTSMLLNEGSFIKSYTTYHWFEKRPASILPDLLGIYVTPSNDPPQTTPPTTFMIPPTIRDFSYIALFPTSSHFSNLTENLPRLDRLYTQFVPRNDDLNDPRKLAHVDPNDLWMERNTCYARLMRELFNSHPDGNYGHLTEFESGDQADMDAWEMAVEYVKRADSGWKIERPGVFVKDTSSAPVETGHEHAGQPLSLLSVDES